MARSSSSSSFTLPNPDISIPLGNPKKKKQTKNKENPPQKPIQVKVIEKLNKPIDHMDSHTQCTCKLWECILKYSKVGDEVLIGNIRESYMTRCTNPSENTKNQPYEVQELNKWINENRGLIKKFTSQMLLNPPKSEHCLSFISHFGSLNMYKWIEWKALKDKPITKCPSSCRWYLICIQLCEQLRKEKQPPPLPPPISPPPPSPPLRVIITTDEHNNTTLLLDRGSHSPTQDDTSLIQTFDDALREEEQKQVEPEPEPEPESETEPAHIEPPIQEELIDLSYHSPTINNHASTYLELDQDPLDLGLGFSPSHAETYAIHSFTPPSPSLRDKRGRDGDHEDKEDEQKKQARLAYDDSVPLTPTHQPIDVAAFNAAWLSTTEVGPIKIKETEYSEESVSSEDIEKIDAMLGLCDLNDLRIIYDFLTFKDPEGKYKPWHKFVVRDSDMQWLKHVVQANLFNAYYSKLIYYFFHGFSYPNIG